MKEFVISILPFIKQALYILMMVTTTILLAVALVTYAEAFKVFSLESVKIRGNETVSADDIFILTGFSFGDEMLSADLQTAAARLESNPFIRKAVISRELPNTFSIVVIERKPFAFIALDELYCTDLNGHLLPPRSHKSFDLPIITGMEDLNLPAYGGKINNPLFQKALNVAKILSEGSIPLYNSISEIHLTPDGEVNLIGARKGTRIYLGKSGFENKLDRIRSLMATVKPIGGLARYHYVDLRFDNQVIVKERS
ncbi:MAG: FtsQ-type POTRA domain-containing protein [Candidatus Marinimicrobia bacterium]|nr:FtsQ-type POTRA domain-containing protein [Candidatus Neomarinimicrobiota bacterium]